ncbi:hypothetical protein [Streptomyces sp. NPDC059479]
MDDKNKNWLRKLARLAGCGLLRGLSAVIGAALARWLLGIL